VQNVRNAEGKLVCRIDEQDRTVEIVHKGYTTLIRFKPDGTVEIFNKHGN